MARRMTRAPVVRSAAEMDDFRARLVWASPEIRAIAGAAKRVAVLGIRSERFADRPAHYVPAYLAKAGVTVLPVPVQETGVTEILGQRCFARVADVPGPIDVVDVFRRGPDVALHLDDLLAARPGCVWMQSGIRNENVAVALAKAGIRVVQDHCLMVEHRAARAMGLVEAWHHDPFFAYVDRYMAQEHRPEWRAWAKWHGAMWDRERPKY